MSCVTPTPSSVNQSGGDAPLNKEPHEEQATSDSTQEVPKSDLTLDDDMSNLINRAFNAKSKEELYRIFLEAQSANHDISKNYRLSVCSELGASVGSGHNSSVSLDKPVSTTASSSTSSLNVPPPSCPVSPSPSIPFSPRDKSAARTLMNVYSNLMHESSSDTIDNLPIEQPRFSVSSTGTRMDSIGFTEPEPLLNLTGMDIDSVDTTSKITLMADDESVLFSSSSSESELELDNPDPASPDNTSDAVSTKKKRYV